MSDCTHRVLVLGATLADAGRYAAEHGLDVEENVTLVSYRSLDRVRGMEIKSVRFTLDALKDEARFPGASYEIRQAMLWHDGCSCDGTHEDCAGCGTAVPYVYVARDAEVSRPDPALGVATLIGLFLILLVILGILFKVLPS